MSSVDEPNLTRRTLQGLQWSTAETVVSSALQIVVAAALARLLDPVDFGLVALATLVLALVAHISRGGLTNAVIQKLELSQADIRTAFTMSMALGLGFAVFVMLLAPMPARFFDNPDVTGVLRWMALLIPISNAGSVADALLRRELRFRRLASINVVSYVVGYGIVGLVMAFMDRGVDALIAAALTQSGLGLVLVYAATRHDVRPLWDREAVRSLTAFGGRVSIIGFLEFVGFELDTVAVGRFGGVAPLGFYSRGYYLVEFPLQKLSSSLSGVMFPALSRVQGEPARLRGGYVSSLRVAGALLLPFAAGVGAASTEIVAVLFGPKWTAAAEVMPWIAVASGLGVLTHFGGVIAEATNNLKPKIRLILVKLVVLTVALWLARDQGLWAFGAATMVAAVVMHIGYTALAARIVGMTFVEAVREYLGALGASVLVAAALVGVRLGALELGLPTIVILVAEVVVAGVLLVGLLQRGWLRPASAEIATRLFHAGVIAPGSKATRMASLVLGPTVTKTVARLSE